MSTQISKAMSYYLRHRPEEIGLTLEAGGWVSVEALISGLATKDLRVSREILDNVVATNDKKRFSFDETGTKIRANQGHSTEVDLQLKRVLPPEVLFHGTAEKFKIAILSGGLVKMNRHHVHLSGDKQTALSVGRRHGKPVIFTVLALKMNDDGFAFYKSENGVWLVDSVPFHYLSF